MVILSLVALVAYLMGSVSFAVVVSRLLHLADPRTFGSGNPGATNMLRGGARLGAALTLLGDAGKGWLAVWLAPGVAAHSALIVPVSAPPTDLAAALSAAAIGVFLGHAYPLYFAFKGGKGVATALGILLAIHVTLGVASLAAWLAVMAITRISSLAALAASVTAPVLAVWLVPDIRLQLTIAGLAVLLVARHRSNIAKLLRGEEAAFRKPRPQPGRD